MTDADAGQVCRGGLDAGAGQEPHQAWHTDAKCQCGKTLEAVLLQEQKQGSSKSCKCHTLPKKLTRPYWEAAPGLALADLPNLHGSLHAVVLTWYVEGDVVVATSRLQCEFLLDPVRQVNCFSRSCCCWLDVLCMQ